MSHYDIKDSDIIILESVDSYLKSINAPMATTPQEKLIITEQARDYLYSEIVRRVPRVAGYLLNADMETNTVAQGLWHALSRHVMDPVFVNLLMQFLSVNNNVDDNGIVGAMLAKMMNKWLEQNWKGDAPKPKTDAEKKKEAKKDSVIVNTTPVIKEETPKNDAGPIKHIQAAVNQLLGNLASIICTRCGNLTQYEALGIAACLAMNNKDTITEILASDLPITAQLFDVVFNPTELIRGALLLEKSSVTKTSTNQQAFLDSLKRWVYDKLNVIPMLTAQQLLIAVYGGARPDVSKYYIQIKDCGKQYSNLLTVATQMLN